MSAAISISFLHVDETVALVLLDEHHAPMLLDLVNANRARLRQWLPWVDSMQTEANFLSYINRCKQQHEAGTDLGYMILANGQPAGRIGIHNINTQNQTAFIGYWLGDAFTGKGIITNACKTLLNHCFEQLNLNRVEILCATGNHKSAAVPERLGFLKEGLMREAEKVNGEFFDLTLYAMLRRNWKAKEMPAVTDLSGV